MKNFKTILVLFSILSVSVLCFGLFKTYKSSIAMEQLMPIDTPKIILEPTAPLISKEDSLVNFALQFIGTPYVYGSCSKDGFDCSGFVYFVFKHFKIEVPRSSSDYKTFGNTISIEDIQKGDILVFLSPTRNVIGHLGIVTNPEDNSIEFIHASSGKQMKVVLSNMDDHGYTHRFVKAVRVL